MIIISSQDLQKNSIALSKSELAFRGKIYTRGQDVKQALRKMAVSLAQDIQQAGSSCLLVDSEAYLTVWYESRKLSEAQSATLARLKPPKRADWSKFGELLMAPEQAIVQLKQHHQLAC